MLRDRHARSNGRRRGAGVSLPGRASRTPAAATPPVGDARQPRRLARQWRARAKGEVRGAGILQAPVIEVIADPGADPDELDARVNELRGRGHRVRIVERAEPERVTVSENPISGHDEILSATVSDTAIELVIPRDFEIDDDGTKLGKIGLAIAKAHGSSAKDIVVRRA